ncbi:T9SS type A sorting domain-containing protein, partial [Klebsiella aerogenes]|uniref:T9SS type A sorting domain-containing protein n=1 Tax=Klebsiella aerogenes TaxID=548 RepID=UPI001CC7E7F9
SVSPSIASTYSATGTSTDACVSAITTSVQVSECTGLNAYTSATTAKVYPNPTNGEFTLELSSVNKSVITITTILGQVVLSQE